MESVHGRGMYMGFEYAGRLKRQLLLSVIISIFVGRLSKNC
jgi:hypothetical protein